MNSLSVYYKGFLGLVAFSGVLSVVQTFLEVVSKDALTAINVIIGIAVIVLSLKDSMFKCNADKKAASGWWAILGVYPIAASIVERKWMPFVSYVAVLFLSMFVTALLFAFAGY